ncbi:MAG TPA: hypothetical protein VND87_12150 [Stellaceae bacterium]|nr:hypothetical protein [Stellaceae bacterium]
MTDGVHITPAEAISHPDLLGPYFAGDSWATWRAVLKAAWAEPLSADELALFRAVAGDREPPRHRVRELVVVAGRRSGKDSIASAIAAAAAIDDYSDRLRPGEAASILCLACDRDQARIIQRYTAAYFRDVPLLRPYVARETADGLELTTGAEIVIGTNSFRALRGRAFACAVFDEVAFWRDETSARPDVETFNAVSPGLVTLDGIIVIISTAYRRSGLVYNKWSAHFGQPGDDVLAVYGPSRAFNPTLKQSIIDAALARDPEAAGAEWLSEWRSDLSDFLDRELVDAAVDPDVVVRPPRPDVSYRAFGDPSGGRGDSFAVAIAHSEGNAAVLDCIWEKRAPFDPAGAVDEIADLLRAYGLSSITGDRYAASWVSSAFQKHGIRYEASERDRSAIYLDALPLFTAGRARLLEHVRLTHQLINLQRRTSRIGKDRVDHGPGGNDDVANAACGALTLVAGRWMAGAGIFEFYRREAEALKRPAAVEPATCPYAPGSVEHAAWQRENGK